MLRAMTISLTDIAALSTRATAGSRATIDAIIALVERLTVIDITIISEIVDGQYRFAGLTSRFPIPISQGDAIPYEACLCSRIHLGESAAVVPETRDEPALWHQWQALRTGLGVDWDVRAFATTDILLPDGELYGTLCVHHREPRTFDDDELALLRVLARLAGDEVGRERSARTLGAALLDRDRAEAARADLVEDLGHELRAPLQVIDGYAEGMLDGVLARDDEHLVLLRRETRRAIRLLDDLASLTRIEIAPAPDSVDEFDLGSLAIDVRDRLAPLADGAGTAITVTTGPGLNVRANRARLDQALTNVVRNALRAAPGGRVTVDVRGAGATAVIAVEDDGDGIPGPELGRLFERFYRGGSAREAGMGSGLGLTIARRIVETAGGRIRAENRAPHGARFVIELPLV